MKFFNLISLAFVSIAAASPVARQEEKRLDFGPIAKLLSSEISETFGGLTGATKSTNATVDAVVKDLENLLSTLISDVEGVATAAGIDISSVLGSAGIASIDKRDVTSAIEQRDVNAIVSAVSKLLTDLLANVVTLAGDAGVSLGSSLSSILNI